MKSLIMTIGLGLLVGIFGFSFKPAQQSNGETNFKKMCSACHTIGGGKLVGPDLKGVSSRRSEAWLIKFIKSSQTLVKSGDKIAVEVFNQNNKIIMPDQNLTDQQVKEILTYIKSKGQ